MKRQIIVLCGLILLTLGIQAQDEASINSFSLGWGMGNLMRQDFNVSPFVHTDWSPLNMQMVYRRSKKLEQQASLRFGHYAPRIGEEYPYISFYGGEGTTLPHSFVLIDLDYSLGKQLAEKGKWTFVLGGESRNKFYPSTYNFGPSGPSPLFISFGLNLWFDVKYNLREKHQLNTSVSLPILSYIYRDPYLAQDDEFFENIYSHKPLKELAERIKDGELESWGTSQGFDFNLSYSYALNEKWDLACTYYLSMNFNQSPTKSSQIENIFYISGTFKF